MRKQRANKRVFKEYSVLILYLRIILYLVFEMVYWVFGVFGIWFSVYLG